MYYYILESSKEVTNQRFRERLTDQTTDVGVAGEMVAVSPLKTIEELIGIGLKKGYNTVVAVGSDTHIHDVIAALMHEPAIDRPVLGAIPTDKNSLVATMLHIPTFKDALQALKFRRLAYATLAAIDPGKFLLTQAVLRPSKPMVFELDIDTAHIEVEAAEVILTGDCHVEVKTPPRGAQTIKQGLAWLFGTSLADHQTSIFHGTRVRINAAASTALGYDGEILAKTPVVAHVIRRALKIIVARATVEPTNQSGSDDPKD